MQLRFLQGNPNTPRGHAIVFARSTAPERVFAVYCIVIPIRFSIGKFLPPILAAQMPAEGLQEATKLNYVPIPPMLEEVEGLAQLETLAELRGDDLCEITTIIRPEDEQTRFTLPAEAGETYAALYSTYAQAFISEHPHPVGGAPAQDVPLDDLDVTALLESTLSDRERLNELAKQIGRARYALEGKDDRQVREIERAMNRTAGPLPEKYRAPDLIAAALAPGERGDKLARLYLERAYKLLDEQYAEIPRIEREIRELF